ncbi:MAG: hypothetical protein PVI56_04695 [Gammaproteobacteria bacterium]
MSMRRWLRVAIWLGMLALLGAAAIARVHHAAPVQTDLIDLLPADQQQSLIQEAVSRNRQTFTRQVLVLISGPDSAHVVAAAQRALNALRKNGLSPASTGDVQALADVYRHHRYALLGKSAARHFTPERLAAETAANLGSPGTLLLPPSEDPGGDLTRFLSALPQAFPGFTPQGDLFVKRGPHRTEVLLSLHLDRSGFGEAGPAEAKMGIEAARASVAADCAACRLLATGAPLFASAAQTEGRTEVGLLSGASLLIIVLLLLAVFHHPRPLLMVGICLLASVIAASASVIILFGQIHLITLVCGTTLLGISVDYAFHYLAQLRFGVTADPWRAMRIIRPGLVLGLVTSLLAFAFLLGAGFPALSQIAVFSGGGLLAAYTTVEAVFPVLARASARPRGPGRLAAMRLPGRWRWLVPLALLLVGLAGLTRIHADDDIRELQNFPAGLLHQDRSVRETIGRPGTPGFFLVTGANVDAMLAAEARLRATVPELVGLARFVPPKADQVASLAAWRRVLANPERLTRAFVDYGLPASLAAAIRKAWLASDRTLLDPSTAFRAAPGLRRFLIGHGNDMALLAVPRGNALTRARLKSLARANRNVQFIAPVERLGETFGRIRRHAIVWVGIGYLLIAALLLLRYGLAGAARVILPPVVSVIVALGLLGWLGMAVNVFVVMALILVLGIGVDYTIFLRESGGREAATRVAVLLSAATTTAAFGLLALSRIPALQAFGLTILAGILVAFLTAPLAVGRSS